MISIAQNGQDEQSSCLTVEVLGDDAVKLSKLEVSFTGYGAFKILVHQVGVLQHLILTCGSGGNHTKIIEEALALGRALDEDRREITTQIENFLNRFIKLVKKEPIQAIA